MKAQRELVQAQEELRKIGNWAMFLQSDRIEAIVRKPYGVDFIKKSGEMIVSGWGENRVFIINKNKIGEPIGPDQMTQPADIAVDDDDYIYVSSKHKLQKFTRSGQLKACVGNNEASGDDLTFNDPRGITIHENRVYVCDRNNHRIQVFNLDLDFIKSIGSYGNREGEIDAPYDVKFDKAGNMYIVELGNKRVQVMDTNDQFIYTFGQSRIGNIGLPTGLHVDKDKNIVYISDFANDRIVVYTMSGDFLTTLGSHGQRVGQLHSPYCTTSRRGKLYVCDSGNNRVQTFDLI